jgi:hypothetical protein
MSRKAFGKESFRDHGYAEYPTCLVGVSAGLAGKACENGYRHLE